MFCLAAAEEEERKQMRQPTAATEAVICTVQAEPRVGRRVCVQYMVYQKEAFRAGMADKHAYWMADARHLRVTGVAYEAVAMLAVSIPNWRCCTSRDPLRVRTRNPWIYSRSHVFFSHCFWESLKMSVHLQIWLIYNTSHNPEYINHLVYTIHLLHAGNCYAKAAIFCNRRSDVSQKLYVIEPQSSQLQYKSNSIDKFFWTFYKLCWTLCKLN